MLDANEIKTQTSLNSESVTPQEAAEMSKADKWAPHISDGLDALENAISKAELKKWSQVLARAWRDNTFKQRLTQDPPSALKEFGIEVPGGLELRVVENTDNVRYITLPSKPANATQLHEEELVAIAAELTSSTSSSRRPATWADTWAAITA